MAASRGPKQNGSGNSRSGKTGSRRKAAGATPAKGRGKARPSAPARSRRRPLLVALLRFGATAAVWLLIAALGLTAWFAYDLPEVAQFEAAVQRQPTLTLVAADGSVLAHRGGVYGVPVRLEELPPHLPHAVLATEDHRFYGHVGLDPIGIARAIWTNLRAGSIQEGGSTITQQLAKNLFLSRDRTLKRKIQEALFALWLEHEFTKDEILTIYLNRVYLGAGTYGVDAAAQRYFDKSARQLSVYESAILAGLLKAPSRDNPLTAPDRADRRARVVLSDMVRVGWLSPDAAQAAARGEAARVTVAGQPGTARYFVDWALSRVDAYVGYVDRDLVIETTLDPRLQGLAEHHLNASLTAHAHEKVGQGALLSLDPGGAVRAMVGGRRYHESQFNRATQALRQPGSAFKLFVYLTAIEAGMRPEDSVNDAPIEVNGWRPRNASGRHLGTVSFREGVARSSNSVAVALAERFGRKRVLATARRLGITTPLQPDPSMALGSHEVTLLEMTGAYAVIANGGFGVWPYGITAIRDKAGATLYRRTGDGPGRLVSEQHVRLMNDVLHATVDWGTAKRARIGRPAAGKTGTSQDSRDAWFIGYTPELVTGVWVGNDDSSPMDGVGGGLVPAGLWREYMEAALGGRPVQPLPGVASDLAARN